MDPIPDEIAQAAHRVPRARRKLDRARQRCVVADLALVRACECSYGMDDIGAALLRAARARTDTSRLLRP